MLDRIARLNPALNCYITVCGEAAMQQAGRLDRLLEAGIHLGPLHGVPIAIKDNIATAGVRTTAASRILADWVPDEDATVVQRLRQAGGVILGKTNLYEFAFGGVHEDYGETRNPWNSAVLAARRAAAPPAWSPRGARLCQPRHRHRRVGATAGRRLRYRRAEADLWTGQPGRRAAGGVQSGSRGAIRAHGAGYGAGAAP